jgi:hypothetical protein
MLAEIADKMPAVEMFWKFFAVLGLVGVLLTVGLSFGRTWAGGLIVVGCACVGVLNLWPDTVMDRATQWHGWRFTMLRLTSSKCLF